MSFDEKEFYAVVLGALLHDIGKFMQRAELEKDLPEIKDNYEEFSPDGRSYLHAAHTAYFIQHFVPDDLVDKSKLYQAAHHHVSGPGDLYREADCLSSGMERYSDEPEPDNFKEIRLNSVFDMVELQYAIRDKRGHLNSRWKHHLVPLAQGYLCEQYPQFAESGMVSDNGFTYRRLWDGFIEEVEDLKKATDILSYFHELYGLLEKYTYCIPSATNVFPDISLFDHSKTTAAIASVLYLVGRGERIGEADFILYGGDLSGIQDYIFKISQSQGVGGIAKRLRGRSFYVAILLEILSRFILEELNLTLVNVNFCSGGNFELLLPNTVSTMKKLDTFEQEVNEWFLEQFRGELGFVAAKVPMTKNELRSMYANKKDEMNDLLAMAKVKKYQSLLEKQEFWQDKIGSEKKTVCRSCNLNLITSGDICDSCDRDRKIGELLPAAKYLSFSKEYQSDTSLNFGKFGSATLWTHEVNISEIRRQSNVVYALGQGTPDVKAFFQLAQTSPKALKTLELSTEKDESGETTVQPGRPLSFATLADMGCGDKRIGVLKMDVDNLGFIFSIGLEAPEEYAKQGNLRSISRLTTLSRQITTFFTAHLDAICTEVFKRWQIDQKNHWPYKDAVSNIFYLIFAGGDDLVIVGPWDQVIELAREIRKRFKEFTCHNPNITISAGIYICKPKYPISHAVKKAEEALKQSKNRGRNRITVMGETAVWCHEDPRSRVLQESLKPRYARFTENEITRESIFKKGLREVEYVKTLTFNELTTFSEKLLEHLDNNHISQGFIRRLIEAKDQFFAVSYNDQEDRFEEEHNLMFLPYLLYSIERNVQKAVRDELKMLLVTGGEAQTYIRQGYYPCRYIFMKRR